MSFKEQMPLFLLGVYLGVLGYRVDAYFEFTEIAKQFSKMIMPIYTPTSNGTQWEFISLLPCQLFVILVGV